jgi:hypothetical protein
MGISWVLRGVSILESLVLWLHKIPIFSKEAASIARVPSGVSLSAPWVDDCRGPMKSVWVAGCKTNKYSKLLDLVNPQI